MERGPISANYVTMLSLQRPTVNDMLKRSTTFSRKRNWRPRLVTIKIQRRLKMTLSVPQTQFANTVIKILNIFGV